MRTSVLRTSGVWCAVAATALTLVMAGCSSDDRPKAAADKAAPANPGLSTIPASAPYNAQDVLFARRILPFQQQGIEMAGIAARQAQRAEVRALAQRLEQAEKSQLATANGRLKAWSERSEEAKDGPDSDVSELPGLVAKEDVSALAAAKGPDFDFMFLTLMIEHHTGAVAVAKQEQGKGKDATAKALARTIEQTHTAEIASMQSLFGAS